MARITGKPGKGTWKVQCDLTGSVYYSDQIAFQEWNNLYVDQNYREEQNPQDTPLMARERGNAGINPLISSITPTEELPPYSLGYSLGYES